jgi:hypothetical protein
VCQGSHWPAHKPSCKEKVTAAAKDDHEDRLPRQQADPDEQDKKTEKKKKKKNDKCPKCDRTHSTHAREVPVAEREQLAEVMEVFYIDSRPGPDSKPIGGKFLPCGAGADGAIPYHDAIP